METIFYGFHKAPRWIVRLKTQTPMASPLEFPRIPSALPPEYFAFTILAILLSNNVFLVDFDGGIIWHYIAFSTFFVKTNKMTHNDFPTSFLNLASCSTFSRRFIVVSSPEA